MTLDSLRACCLALPGATEDVKWTDDLVFLVCRKMFAMVLLDPPHRVSFKCSPEAYAELIEREGIVPAPYLARHHWVTVRELNGTLEDRELRACLERAYTLVRDKLPRKLRDRL